MVRFVRSAESGEFLRIGHPVEVAAVHHCTSYLGREAVHVLCRGMGDDVRTPFERPAVDRSCKRVVHDEGNTVPVRY